MTPRFRALALTRIRSIKDPSQWQREQRQARRMSLGDALTAASAITSDLELWTHSTEDYRNIPELKLFDPLVLA